MRSCTQIVRRGSDTIFDLLLYLFRLKQDKGVGFDEALVMVYRDAASVLSYDHLSRRGYRQRMNRALRKLQSRYEVLDFTFERGGPALVKWNTNSPITLDSSYFEVPQAYWDYGLSVHYPPKVKMAYLICLCEGQSTHSTFFWTMSGAKLSAKYGITRDSLSKSLRFLARENVLEIVTYEAFDGDYESRRPNRYRLKPLISPEELEARWKELEATHGRKRLEQAMKLAQSMDHGKDPDALAGFIGFIETYGLAETQVATEIVARLKADNQRRNMGYLRGVLEGRAADMGRRPAGKRK